MNDDRLFLDTNAYVAYKSGDERVLHALVRFKEIHLSLFVWAELLTGFKGGNREKKNRNELDYFMSKPGVRLTLPTSQTAEYFALVKTGLQDKGNPISINDIWIAAHCMELSSVLCSYDHHFNKVAGLRIYEW